MRISASHKCLMNIDSLKMATKCHEDGAKNKFLLLFAGNCAPHHPQNFLFGQQFLSSSIFKFRGQKPEQVLVDILPSPYILICRAEPLWVGQAIDACLYTATYETCTTSTKSVQRSNTYAVWCTWTIGSVPSRTLLPPTPPPPPLCFCFGLDPMWI